MKTWKIGAWMMRYRLRLGAGLVLVALAGAAFLAYANLACKSAARGRVFCSVPATPESAVGLLLGTSKEIRHGRANLHFTQRIEAAAALYRAGKVRHLLVSGDNHIASYNEPQDMRAALIAAGVPPAAITCDYAGFRTLDSVVRARAVFGLSHCLIITEAFHCPRALWIAQRHGLDAIAFAAPDVGLKSWKWRAQAREQLARSWCAVDLYLLHRGPKYLGPTEPIAIGNRTPA